MREITEIYKVYSYDELSDDAKEKAKQWFLEGIYDYEWWDSTYEDATTIGLTITEFDLNRYRHAKGHFNKQAGEVASSILQEHGKDCETYKTAERFLNEYKKLLIDDDGYFEDQDKADELEDEFLQSLLEDYSIMLQHDADYMASDEYLEDGIKANEYEFLEDGRIA